MTDSFAWTPGAGQGRIDVHSHLLPGIDDGCQSVSESIECVQRLMGAGYVGTICTPHVNPDFYPMNTPAHIGEWTDLLRTELTRAGLEYSIWPGAEVHLSRGVLEWMQSHGVPTLADSRCVLFDFWGDKWPRWVTKIIEWLLAEGYQPILAHPERTRASANQPKRIDQFVQMGVKLQGNFAPMTGEDSYHADRLVREYLAGGRYDLMALDMHGPLSLDSRFDGMQLVAMEFGRELLDEMTIHAPRRIVFDR